MLYSKLQRVHRPTRASSPLAGLWVHFADVFATHLSEQRGLLECSKFCSGALRWAHARQGQALG